VAAKSSGGMSRFGAGGALLRERKISRERPIAIIQRIKVFCYDNRFATIDAEIETQKVEDGESAFPQT